MPLSFKSVTFGSVARALSRAVPVVLVLVGLCAARPAQADVITFFDFNNTSTLFNSSGGTRTSTITTNFPVSIIGVGTTVNSDPDGAGPFPASAAGNSIGFRSVNADGTSNQGKYFQFGLNTTGYTNLNLSFATNNVENGGGTPNGFNNNTLQYSLDGTNFTNFTNYVPLATSTEGVFGLQSFDFGSVAGLNNNANAAFRIVFNGGSTTDTSARNRFDNIAVQGTNAAPMGTPEPETWAMMGLGLLALGIYSWRRKQNESAPAPVFGGFAV